MRRDVTEVAEVVDEVAKNVALRVVYATSPGTIPLKVWANGSNKIQADASLGLYETERFATASPLLKLAKYWSRLKEIRVDGGAKAGESVAEVNIDGRMTRVTLVTVVRLSALSEIVKGKEMGGVWSRFSGGLPLRREVAGS